MEPTFDPTAAREVDARATDGVEVRLLWDPATDRVAVEVNDSRSGEQFAIPVAGADALDAFHHPFAYAAAERAGATDQDTHVLPLDIEQTRREVTR
jgi:hypothetical protein